MLTKKEVCFFLLFIYFIFLYGSEEAFFLVIKYSKLQFICHITIFHIPLESIQRHACQFEKRKKKNNQQPRQVSLKQKIIKKIMEMTCRLYFEEDYIALIRWV